MDEKILKALLGGEIDEKAREEIVKSILEADDPKGKEALEKAMESLSEKGKGAVKAAVKLLSVYKSEIPKEVLGAIVGLAGFGYEPVKKEEPKKEAKDDLKPGHPIRKEDGTWDLSGVPDEQRPFFTSILKEQEDVRKEKADLQKKLDAEIATRRERDYIAKAAASFPNLPGTKAEELGNVLMKIADKDPESAAQVEKILGAADKAIKEGALFAELGRPGFGSGGNAWEKIVKMADGLVEKDAKLTREQAIEKVMDLHPDLYAEYSKEQAAVTRQ